MVSGMKSYRYNKNLQNHTTRTKNIRAKNFLKLIFVKWSIFLEKYKSPKLTQEEKENPNRSITMKETEAVIP